MNKIKDNEIKLIKAIVDVNQIYTNYHPDLVKAKLQVHYHADETALINCTVDVGEELSETLFVIKLDYQVPTMEVESREEYINQIGELIKPRIEDIINYVITETGHQEI